MKVYVVYIRTYRDLLINYSEPRKVFLSEDKAKEYCDLDDSGGHVYIELEVDESNLCQKLGKMKNKQQKA